MKFVYASINPQTQQQESGEIEANSESEALRLLQERKLEIISIKPQKGHQGKKKKVTVSDLVLPLTELATLTESGVVLVDAISALANNKEHYGLAMGFKEIAAEIESGENFSTAISKSKLPFPEYVSHLVKAGELSGQLAQSLKSIANQITYDESIRSDLKSALTYPLILVGSGIAAMLIIFFAVVPQFSHMLDTENELPTLAWAVLSAGKYANEYPLVIFGSLFMVIAALVYTFSNPSVRSSALNVLIELPVIGPWLAEQDASRWAGLCAAMLTARVSLVSALNLAAQSSIFTNRKKKALQIEQDIQTGVSLSEAIERSGLLPRTSLNLINVGDKTGKLAQMMTAVARLHDESCKRRMKEVMTLIEPIAILIVGILIGIMILGIVMAITASTDIAL